VKSEKADKAYMKNTPPVPLAQAEKEPGVSLLFRV
jgi:hypothetical protein